MVNPYSARVNERHFLNLPGFHDGAYVVCYVEDTSQRQIDEKRSYSRNPQPRLILEIADCSERIQLEFEIDDALARKNAFHKLDTLIGALTSFRDGLAEECVVVKERARGLRVLDEAKEATKTP
jgi:hypothetical protein